MKCLIVEDDSTSRLLLQKQLEHYGDCHVAMNGIEAVKAVRMAMDIGEPYDLSGILSCDGAKIVMTTTLNDMRNVSIPYCSLADGYLVKPIEREELIAFLEKSQLLGPSGEQQQYTSSRQVTT